MQYPSPWTLKLLFTYIKNYIMREFCVALIYVKTKHENMYSPVSLQAIPYSSLQEVAVSLCLKHRHKHTHITKQFVIILTCKIPDAA